MERDNKGRFIKGQRAWNKGLKMSERFKEACRVGHTGIVLSDYHKSNISKSNKGLNSGSHNGMYGTKYIRSSLVTCELCGEKIKSRAMGQHRLFHDPEYTQKRSDRAREYRLTQVLPNKDTLPERKLQDFLTSQNIKFIKHKTILNFCQPDIFIEPNICIFADGDYWHKRPKTTERDEYVTMKLLNNGFVVLRFWEREIHNTFKDVTDRLLRIV